MKILALKILVKTPKKWGIYRPNRKLAVGLIWQPDRLAVGRPGRPPTVRNVTVGATRSTARPTAQIQRADSLIRSAARPTARPTAQIQRARLSDPVGRPADRPTVPADVHKSVHVGRPAWSVSTVLGQKHLLKIFLKIFYLL